MAGREARAAKLFGDGMNRFQRGKYESAATAFDWSIRYIKCREQYHLSYAEALLEVGGNQALTKAAMEYELYLSFAQIVDHPARIQLANTYIRLGQVEAAQKHLNLVGRQDQPHPLDAQGMNRIEYDTACYKISRLRASLTACMDARRAAVQAELDGEPQAIQMQNWQTVYEHVIAARSSGAELSQLVNASMVEVKLKLNDPVGANAFAQLLVERRPFAETTFLGFVPEAYISFTMAQVYLASQRYEDAYNSLDHALTMDSTHREIQTLLHRCRLDPGLALA